MDAIDITVKYLASYPADIRILEVITNRFQNCWSTRRLYPMPNFCVGFSKDSDLLQNLAVNSRTKSKAIASMKPSFKINKINWKLLPSLSLHPIMCLLLGMSYIYRRKNSSIRMDLYHIQSVSSQTIQTIILLHRWRVLIIQNWSGQLAVNSSRTTIYFFEISHQLESLLFRLRLHRSFMK
jgi:hypothetical protein